MDVDVGAKCEASRSLAAAGNATCSGDGNGSDKEDDKNDKKARLPKKKESRRRRRSRRQQINPTKQNKIAPKRDEQNRLGERNE